LASGTVRRMAAANGDVGGAGAEHHDSQRVPLRQVEEQQETPSPTTAIEPGASQRKANFFIYFILYYFYLRRAGPAQISQPRAGHQPMSSRKKLRTAVEELVGEGEPSSRSSGAEGGHQQADQQAADQQQHRTVSRRRFMQAGCASGSPQPAFWLPSPTAWIAARPAAGRVSPAAGPTI